VFIKTDILETKKPAAIFIGRDRFPVKLVLASDLTNQPVTPARGIPIALP
jgi:hypothetical protein